MGGTGGIGIFVSGSLPIFVRYLRLEHIHGSGSAQEASKTIFPVFSS